VVYFHHPHYTSGAYYPSADRQVEGLADLWALMAWHRVDLVLNGHDHIYERFAKQDAAGNRDPDGVRQFTVGTGGSSQYRLHNPPLANSEFRYNASPGVLKLTLHQDWYGYEWEYRTLEPGNPVRDAGYESCN
jgi:3',5'-cyclic AMP phosphodiesterase CpdA